MKEKITLKGGAVVEVDFIEVSECRSCGRMIWWAKTKKGKDMPITFIGKRFTDKNNLESHFANCKQANQWRKKQDAKNNSTKI